MNTTWLGCIVSSSEKDRQLSAKIIRCLVAWLPSQDWQGSWLSQSRWPHWLEDSWLGMTIGPKVPRWRF